MKEYWDFLKNRKKYWLLPILMIATIVFIRFIIIERDVVVIPINYIKF